ncbi:hypothetical protein A3K73_03720 [Candidatus Pacearchaeota archaeon RBG_13_36_9]|nr:MAG: hypothetical protein A3K73_03720 [Candidatus Pacearchaeota archaeon RBG_13_36_9]
MIMKIKPDYQKSKALIEMAKVTFERLNKTEIYKYPTNTLTDYYDILHKLMESLALVNGVKTKGEGAHQELIDYICKTYSFSESIRIFLQEMRDYRNRTSYEGFMVNQDYIKSNLNQIKSIIADLGKLLNVRIF